VLVGAQATNRFLSVRRLNALVGNIAVLVSSARKTINTSVSSIAIDLGSVRKSIVTMVTLVPTSMDTIRKSIIATGMSVASDIINVRKTINTAVVAFASEFTRNLRTLLVPSTPMAVMFTRQQLLRSVFVTTTPTRTWLNRTNKGAQAAVSLDEPPMVILGIPMGGSKGATMTMRYMKGLQIVATATSTIIERFSLVRALNAASTPLTRSMDVLARSITVEVAAAARNIARVPRTIVATTQPRMIWFATIATTLRATVSPVPRQTISDRATMLARAQTISTSSTIAQRFRTLLALAQPLARVRTVAGVSFKTAVMSAASVTGLSRRFVSITSTTTAAPVLKTIAARFVALMAMVTGSSSQTRSNMRYLAAMSGSVSSATRAIVDSITQTVGVSAAMSRSITDRIIAATVPLAISRATTVVQESATASVINRVDVLPGHAFYTSVLSSAVQMSRVGKLIRGDALGAGTILRSITARMIAVAPGSARVVVELARALRAVTTTIATMSRRVPMSFGVAAPVWVMTRVNAVVALAATVRPLPLTVRSIIERYTATVGTITATTMRTTAKRAAVVGTSTRNTVRTTAVRRVATTALSRMRFNVRPILRGAVAASSTLLRAVAARVIAASVANARLASMIALTARQNAALAASLAITSLRSLMASTSTVTSRSEMDGHDIRASAPVVASSTRLRASSILASVSPLVSRTIQTMNRISTMMLPIADAIRSTARTTLADTISVPVSRIVRDLTTATVVRGNAATRAASDLVIAVRATLASMVARSNAVLVSREVETTAIGQSRVAVSKQSRVENESRLTGGHRSIAEMFAQSTGAGKFSSRFAIMARARAALEAAIDLLPAFRPRAHGGGFPRPAVDWSRAKPKRSTPTPEITISIRLNGRADVKRYPINDAVIKIGINIRKTVAGILVKITRLFKQETKATVRIRDDRD
jgi:hypothetical protein